MANPLGEKTGPSGVDMPDMSLEMREQVERLVGGSKTRLTRAVCKVCEEPIVETLVTHPATGEMVFGSRNTFKPSWLETRYHCSGCGICYKFVREESVQ